jgi:hypothetical protein
MLARVKRASDRCVAQHFADIKPTFLSGADFGLRVSREIRVAADERRGKELYV